MKHIKLLEEIRDLLKKTCLDIGCIPKTNAVPVYQNFWLYPKDGLNYNICYRFVDGHWWEYRSMCRSTAFSCPPDKWWRDFNIVIG